MFDINKHKFYMLQILRDIYRNPVLSAVLGFKGGTACMFFYGLPRFSTDLDFNLLDVDKEKQVYEEIRKIVLKYGKIHDEAMKFYGPLIVLDYGAGERKLKIEISKRNFEDSYSVRNLLGIDIRVMDSANMLSHKLCALLDRTELTNRDIFDSWFLMEKRTPIVRRIVEERMGMKLENYLEKCVETLSSLTPNGLLNGLGELMDEEWKKFVRSRLLPETIQLLEFYRMFPLEAPDTITE